MSASVHRGLSRKLSGDWFLLDRKQRTFRAQYESDESFFVQVAFAPEEPCNHDRPDYSNPIVPPRGMDYGNPQIPLSNYKDPVGVSIGSSGEVVPEKPREVPYDSWGPRIRESDANPVPLPIPFEPIFRSSHYGSLYLTFKDPSTGERYIAMSDGKGNLEKLEIDFSCLNDEDLITFQFRADPSLYDSFEDSLDKASARRKR